jgi:hypothetical protein
MTILPHPHASPLPSWASRPPTPHRAPSFGETLGIIWRWWRGVQPSWRERVKEQRLVDRLADELPEEPEPEPDHSAKLQNGPTAKAEPPEGLQFCRPSAKAKR